MPGQVDVHLDGDGDAVERPQDFAASARRVGSIGGTILSAFGIGGIDQVLQQYLPNIAPGLGWVPGIGGFLQNLAQDAAVFGKILVLAGIILFLQWKPAGLFVTRSRSLDE